MNYISIHHFPAPTRDRIVYCKNGKKYPYEEYKKLVHKKQLIKDIIFMVCVSVVAALRAYVFFEYGV
jgi:hypothetical protein